MRNLFPPAPPLRGKTDPMTGFTYTGALRPVVANLWLIPRNPIAGLGMGVVWAATWAVSTALPRGDLIGTIASFSSFGALIAAGAIGWQRPWLYGLVAGFFGYLIYAAYVVIGLSGQIADAGASTSVAVFLLINGSLQTMIGGLAGFYGGYLRRMMSDPNRRRAANAAAAARKRR
jgi:hypothetical protein